MNAIIRSLIAECTTISEVFDTASGYGSILVEKLDKKKFAELIVQECISIPDELFNRSADGTWTSNELYTDYNGALFEVKRRIEQHFGAE